jgi:NDP-sugar pyrophosphorylase family protein
MSRVSLVAEGFQIIIPMSGIGERFLRCGYKLPKPLIKVDGKPILAHVIDMFPGEHNFIFVCNNEHLARNTLGMRETIEGLCPSGTIIGIEPHKLGPVHAVLEIKHLISERAPTIINYCDFSCYWDWAHFKTFVRQSECSGAIPAYRGFHPHSLRSTNYAYLSERFGWVTDVQEKRPYTANPMDEYASSGTYYFASGSIALDALRATVRRGLSVGGEFYVSMAYKHLLENRQPVAVYPLQHFMQWGTPEDLEEYVKWSELAKHYIEVPQVNTEPIGTTIVPAAGLGKRFLEQGYLVPKPLLPISGRPMLMQAVRDLPPARDHSFILLEAMQGHDDLKAELTNDFPGALVASLPEQTKGQACSALMGLDLLEQSRGSVSEPVTFGACDNGILYNVDKFLGFLADPDIDIVVWGVRGHTNAIRHPNMFGWIDAAHDGRIARISVKNPLAAPSTDPIVIGTFTFKRVIDFRNAISRLVSRDGRINGEFYIDACINDAIAMGLQCYLFEVDHFVSWGTPTDVLTFEYWQSCFHKWDSHPYRLDLDRRIPHAAISELRRRYRAELPVIPKKRA